MFTIELRSISITRLLEIKYNAFMLYLAGNPDSPVLPGHPDNPVMSGLPQTGQLNWPVPVLAVSGVVLFAFGWALDRKYRTV